MKLCSSFSINRTLILELESYSFASLNLAVSQDEELIVPRLSCTNSFLSILRIAIILSRLPITLLTIYDILCSVGNDINGIRLFIHGSLEHLECDRFVLSVKINFPNAKSGKIQPSITRSCIFLPIIGIVLNLTCRLQCSTLVSRIITTSGRYHQLVNISSAITFLTHNSN